MLEKPVFDWLVTKLKAVAVDINCPAPCEIGSEADNGARVGLCDSGENVDGNQRRQRGEGGAQAVHIGLGLVHPDTFEDGGKLLVDQLRYRLSPRTKAPEDLLERIGGGQLICMDPRVTEGAQLDGFQRIDRTSCGWGT